MNYMILDVNQLWYHNALMIIIIFILRLVF